MPCAKTTASRLPSHREPGSDEMQRSLDYEGKLDRSPENVETLIAHGEERGRSFLAERARRVGAAGASPVN